MKSFIDSNVLIYWVEYSERAATVESLLADDATISVQVLNEFTKIGRASCRERVSSPV